MYSTLPLTGKTALVTGASRGIGRAIATRLAADGALVAVHYGSNEAAATDTVEAIQAAGGRAFAVHAELGVDGDVDTLVEGLTAGLGDSGLDILVNNAATTDPLPWDKTTAEAFDRLYAVNVRAPFLLTQRLVPLMRDGGRIVNVSSRSTGIALPEIAYAMTKGAVDVFTFTLAKVVGERGITVNAVAPGPIDTGQPMFQIPQVVEGMAQATALNRVGKPEDIAGVVGFLASDDSRWVTGQVIDACGGLLLGPTLP